MPTVQWTRTFHVKEAMFDGLSKSFSRDINSCVTVIYLEIYRIYLDMSFCRRSEILKITVSIWDINGLYDDIFKFM